MLHSYNIPNDNYGNSFVFFVENFFTNGVCRSAVPMFFLISGYLFFQNFEISFIGYINKVKRRIKSLVIPFLIWSGFFVSIAFLSSMFKFNLINRSVLSINDFFVILVLSPIPYQLWFIRDLFIIVLLSPVIYFFVRYFSYLFLPLLFIIWLPNWQIFYIIDNESFLFFSLGTFFGLFAKSTALRIYNKRMPFFISICLWITFLLLKHIPSGVGVISPLYLRRFSEIMGIVSIWVGYDLAINSKKKIPLNICKLIFMFRCYSFFIFLSHEPIMTMLKKIALYFYKFDLYLLFLYFTVPLFTIYFCIGLAANTLEKFPKVYLVLTGNR